MPVIERFGGVLDLQEAVVDGCIDAVLTGNDIPIGIENNDGVGQRVGLRESGGLIPDAEVAAVKVGSEAVIDAGVS